MFIKAIKACSSTQTVFLLTDVLNFTWVISHVPIEHHPTIRYMVYNGYYKVMSNIPKMGHLPTPVST